MFKEEIKSSFKMAKQTKTNQEKNVVDVKN